MNTYWVRFYSDLENSTNYWDTWITGQNCDGDKDIRVGAIRADSVEDVYSIFDEMFCSGSYEIDSVAEKPYTHYRDFVGDRFRMADKYHNDPIDSVDDIRNRFSK